MIVILQVYVNTIQYLRVKWYTLLISLFYLIPHSKYLMSYPGYHPPKNILMPKLTWQRIYSTEYNTDIQYSLPLDSFKYQLSQKIKRSVSPLKMPYAPKATVRSPELVSLKNLEMSIVQLLPALS